MIVFSSTHFLTGDGGFIQAVMMGYAGLRFDEKGIMFNPLSGVLTPASKSIRLRNVLVRGTYPFNYAVDYDGVHFQTTTVNNDVLCVTDKLHQKWTISSHGLDLSFEEISLPIHVDLCM